MSSAVLLIAHGSRRAEANADLVDVAEMLKSRVPGRIVEISYLEIAHPTIPEGLAQCVRAGATQIDMLPWFLSAGSHVTDDLHAERDRFLAEHPQIACNVRPPLGLHPLMIDVLLERLADG